MKCVGRLCGTRIICTIAEYVRETVQFDSVEKCKLGLKESILEIHVVPTAEKQLCAHGCNTVLTFVNLKSKIGTQISLFLHND